MSCSTDYLRTPQIVSNSHLLANWLELQCGTSAVEPGASLPPNTHNSLSMAIQEVTLAVGVQWAVSTCPTVMRCVVPAFAQYVLRASNFRPDTIQHSEAKRRVRCLRF